MDSPANDHAAIAELAASNGLDIIPETITMNELGLDFRVAIAEANDGNHWVLRIPRRPDVMPRAEVEGRLLQHVNPLVDVAVPDWQIHNADIIAYPLLPGEPGLTLSDLRHPVRCCNQFPEVVEQPRGVETICRRVMNLKSNRHDLPVATAGVSTQSEHR